MAPLLLLASCALLTRSGSTLIAVSQYAGEEVTISCPPCNEQVVWTWAPQNPHCVTVKSNEGVTNSGSVGVSQEIKQHFKGRLNIQESCDLKLKKLQVNDSGTFTCTVKNRESHSVTLNVNHGSLPARKDFKTSCCRCGEKVLWNWAPLYPHCVTVKSKEVVIYNGSVGRVSQEITELFEGRLKVKDHCALELKEVRVNDSGTFTCTVNNQTLHSVTLNVTHGCKKGPVSEGSDQLGRRMKLHCCTDEDQSPFTWTLNGRKVNNSLTDRPLRTSVIIESLRPEHRGLWTCQEEDGDVVTELCLEVTEETHGGPGSVQPTYAPPDGHSTMETHSSCGVTKPTPTQPNKHSTTSGPLGARPDLVWAIAGTLAAILFILLMVGVYCCLRARSKGRSHREVKGVVNDACSEPTHPQMEPPQRKEAPEEIQYCLLDFPMAEGRAAPPRTADNMTLYSEVAVKT